MGRNLVAVLGKVRVERNAAGFAVTRRLLFELVPAAESNGTNRREFGDVFDVTITAVMLADDEDDFLAPLPFTRLFSLLSLSPTFFHATNSFRRHRRSGKMCDFWHSGLLDSGKFPCSENTPNGKKWQGLGKLPDIFD